MSAVADIDGEEWFTEVVESSDDDLATNDGLKAAIQPSSVKRVQAFGWLKQQALLRDKKLNPKGDLLKQRLFRSAMSTGHQLQCLPCLGDVRPK